MRGVARHQLQQEITAAANHVTFAHFRPASHQRLEGGKDGLLLAVQADDGEEGDLPAQLLRVGVGLVAADDARLFQPAHPAQARRGGDAGAARQFNVGDPAIRLQLEQNAAVDGVQDRQAR